MNYLKLLLMLPLILFSRLTSAMGIPDKEPPVKDSQEAVEDNKRQEQQAPPEKQLRMDKQEMEDYNQNVHPDDFDVDKGIYEQEKEEYDTNYN